MNQIQMRCCVVGGGPAGMMLGLLLARAGVEVRVLEKHADFVFGTDGRHSTVRQSAGLGVQDFGVPIDVLWFRLQKPSGLPDFLLARIRNGQMMVTIDRGDYFQVAVVIPKGAFEKIQGDGLENFRKTIAAITPEFHDVVSDLNDWNKIKLLTVQINRLRQWHRAGLLCIGDAAHAMSPAGGVGINLAIQDAVAAANLLANKILRNECTTEDLALVQRRREFPVRMTQRIQIFIHRRMFGKNSGKAISLSWPARKILALLAPLLRRIGTRIVGIGFRPEHIETMKHP